MTVINYIYECLNTFPCLGSLFNSENTITYKISRRIIEGSKHIKQIAFS